MPIFQRTAGGSLQRMQRAIGGIGRFASSLLNGTNAGECCCASQLWRMLIPCNTEPPGWWNCDCFAAEPDTGCRWITEEKFLSLIAEAEADTGFFGQLIVYDSVSEACYRNSQFCAIATSLRADVPGDGYDATDVVTYVGAGQCCDFPGDCGGEDCDDCGDPTDDCDQNPPVDPPPDPGPADCAACGTPDGCGFCECTPAYGIRVTLSGLSNCTCVGPCGVGPSYAYARMKDGQTFNGTYDLVFMPGACEWRYDTAKTLLTGTPGDPSLCGSENTTSFSIHLKKLDATTWVLAIYKNDPDPTDPRLDDATTDLDQARAFSGSSASASNKCLSIASMANVLGCGCHDTATSDGRFNICTGGEADFTILCGA